MRGEVFELPAPRGARGDEQHGPRFAVVVQSDDARLSTWVVCPTSTRAKPSRLRPEITLRGQRTLILDQIAAIDAQRVGPSAGFLSHGELQVLDAAIKLLLDLV